MSDLTLEPVAEPFATQFTPPGSKSLTNRALVLAALAEGACTLSNCLFADDTHLMIDGLKQLGFSLNVSETNNQIAVEGRGGTILAESAELFCGNSGTTIRFLTALCALGRGTYRLDGIPRMRERPIEQLAELLKNLGARIEFAEKEGFPPVVVRGSGGGGGGSIAGGIARFGKAQSSQFLSAVLQVCPYARHEVRIDLEPGQTSWPYVAMTMQLMDEFGLTPELHRDPLTGEPKQVVIPRGKYAATNYAVEPDASNASYFLAAAALHEGAKVTVNGLGKRSLQGDVGFADVLHKMGADLIFGGDFITVMGSGNLEGIDVDLANMPDVAQTLAVVALFAKGETVIRGLHTLRLKETDRVNAIATELRKFGADVEVEGDDLAITPPRDVRPGAVDTYDDHRMAMSFALAGTKVGGVLIRHKECVNKTYPRYFEDLARVTGAGARMVG
jgi:3-phosphoshikimate 1-carboxyvinyltransferase